MHASSRARAILRRLAPLAVVALLAPAAAHAQAKIGVFDKQRIVDQSKLGTTAKTKLDKLVTARQDEVEGKRSAFEGMRKTYEQQQAALSDEKRLERQRELARQHDEVQSLMDNADRDLQRATQQAQIELAQKINPVIEDYAKTEGFDFLFDQEQYFYAKPQYDVTDAIIAKLDAMYPQGVNTPGAAPAK